MTFKRKQKIKHFTKTTGEDTALNTCICTREHLGNPSKSCKSNVATHSSSFGLAHLHVHTPLSMVLKTDSKAKKTQPTKPCFVLMS